MTNEKVYKLEIDTQFFFILEKDLLEYKFYKYCEEQYGKFVGEAILGFYTSRASLDKMSYITFLEDEKPFRVVILRHDEPRRFEKMIKIISPENIEYKMYYWHDIIPVYFTNKEFFDISLEEFQQLIVSANKLYCKMVLKNGLVILR